jgi:thiol-disulfide isomerase/thioredoxin
MMMTDEPAMEETMPMTPEPIMTEEMMATDSMSTEMPDRGMSDEGTMEPEGMMETPAWFDISLTDVNTGESFTINDFSGKVVVVEAMAIWCPKCLSQQKEIKSLFAQMGMDGIEYVVLDVDPNEDAESLAQYTQQNGFEGRYAVAPAELNTALADLYGSQFLNPSAVPMLIIDAQGEVHVLPLGSVKSVSELQEALDPILHPDM